jgi:hypothetical protein
VVSKKKTSSSPVDTSDQG